MNKNYIRLIIGILTITIVTLLLFSTMHQTVPATANIYYENELIKTIDLSQNDQKEYTIEGKNGLVIIEVNHGKIRVKEENSPLHICSKQGYISKSSETIICLPNRIVIEIEAKGTVDTVVR